MGAENGVIIWLIHTQYISRENAPNAKKGVKYVFWHLRPYFQDFGTWSNANNFQNHVEVPKAINTKYYELLVELLVFSLNL